MLKLDSTTRRRLPAYLAVLLLAFAVSSWGLHYKLSLYHTGAARPAVPAAKLLSQKERPLASAQAESHLLSSQPFRLAAHPALSGGFAALAADAHLDTPPWPVEERFGRADAHLARSRGISQTSPRAPPLPAC